MDLETSPQGIEQTTARQAGVVTASEAPAKRSVRAQNRLRRMALLAHRYVGLAMAVFLFVAGVTGTALAFYQELDAAISPELLRAEPPHAGAPLLDPFVLSDRVRAALPEARDHQAVSFSPKPGQALSVWLQLEPEKWREFFVNPYTAAVLGSRDWGNLAEGTKNLMPFVYRLHYALALGEVGTILFGCIALLWTFDCFVGAYLTFPTPVRDKARKPRKPWVSRWLPAWLIKGNKLFSFVFTWHRASGLWVWAMLMVFAWSAVALNLNAVYEPVMKALTGMEPSVHDGLPELQPPFPKPGFELREAHAIGKRLMAEQAQKHGFTVQREGYLVYHQDHGVYSYAVASNLDISSKRAGTEVYFDGKDGRFLGLETQTGKTAGNTITNWLIALHFAQFDVLWYRVFVSLMGVAVAALSVSGVWIWLRKRRKRAHAV